MIDELTVRENMSYSAYSKLPRSWTSSQIEQFVDKVLDTLGLTDIKNQLAECISGG